MEHNTKKSIRGLAALVAISLPSSPAHADFYDGVRGPSKAQVHYTLSNQDATISHTLAGKYFGDNTFAVGAVAADGKSILGGFAGIGYIIEQSEKIKAIPVIGYSISGDGKEGTLNGILQATAFLDNQGRFLADPHYSLAVHMYGQKDYDPIHTMGLTLSVGNGQVRFGPDFNYSFHNPDIAVNALVRYDIDAEKHSSWVEIGLGTNGNAQIQFRGNF